MLKEAYIIQTALYMNHLTQFNVHISYMETSEQTLNITCHFFKFVKSVVCNIQLWYNTGIY